MQTFRYFKQTTQDLGFDVGYGPSDIGGPHCVLGDWVRLEISIYTPLLFYPTKSKRKDISFKEAQYKV